MLIWKKSVLGIWDEIKGIFVECKKRRERKRKRSRITNDSNKNRKITDEYSSKVRKRNEKFQSNGGKRRTTLIR